MPRSRSLVAAERELLKCFSDRLDLDRVRIYHGRSFVGRTVTLLTRGAAIALGYRIFTPREFTLPVLAHELAHVCQYQEWGPLLYYARGVWNQVVRRGVCRQNVYHWEPQPGKSFNDYGMEQQGQIVQDSFDVHSPRRAEAQRLSPFTPK